MTVPKNSLGSYVFQGESPYSMKDITEHETVDWFKEDASVLLHGYFKAEEAGNYTFINQFNLAKSPLNKYSKANPNGVVCAVRLNIEGNEIIAETVILDVNNYKDGSTIVNGLELQKGYYNTKLWVSCSVSGNAKATVNDVGFSLRVKEPKAMSAHHVQAGEILIKVK